jgi:cell division protein FtsI/penicillin-binding protein 2
MGHPAAMVKFFCAGTVPLENSKLPSPTEDVASAPSVYTTCCNFFAEIFSNASNAVSSDKPAEGDIVSWIEPSVQTYLEQQIDEVHKDWKTDLTAGIIMDPKTGAILAMAATPDFDPNTYNTEKDISRFSNPLVENIYEMGSIIKPLTMAAGIDAGAVNASTTYNDKGSLTLDGFTIYNFDKKARAMNDGKGLREELIQVAAVAVAWVEAIDTAEGAG